MTLGPDYSVRVLSMISKFCMLFTCDAAQAHCIRNKDRALNFSLLTYNM